MKLPGKTPGSFFIWGAVLMRVELTQLKLATTFERGH